MKIVNKTIGTMIGISLSSKIKTPAVYLTLIISMLTMSLSPGRLSANADETIITFEFSDVIISEDDARARAVAFHSITFIDSRLTPIDSIVFGTSEANSLQGAGWFENESYPGIVSFQWAGTEAKQADIRLTLPMGTQALLLKIKSAQDSLWMKVRIDGELAAILRVDAFWHLGYVSIEEVTPEPVSDAGPVWTEGRYFPRFPQAEQIVVLPVRNTKLGQAHITGKADFRINQEYHLMMALTLTGMQGIINRSKPRVYLSYHNSDIEWLTHLEPYVNIIQLDLDKLSAVNYLLDHYLPLFTGAVIYDPEVPETINLANMIAGLDDRIMLAPEQLALPGIPDFTSVKDLRDLVQDQNWDTSDASKLRIYQWVYDSLWPELEHRMIGVISPGPPTSQAYSTNSYFGMGLAIRDYFTALKLPVLWLDPRNPQEAELYDRFLADAPSPIPVHGASPWEVSSVPFVSGHGDWVTALSWPQNPLDGSNLTVFSGVRPEIKKYEPRIDQERILATLHKQHIAMIYTSDGDNLGYQMYRGFNSFRWFDAIDQEVAFGWTTSPALIDLAPVAWNYYIDSRNEVELMCGFSGAGYAQPRSMNEDQLKNYLQKTATYLEETGLKTIWINDDPNNSTWNEELADVYNRILGEPGMLGYIFGAGGNPWRPFHLSYAGAPIPCVRVSHVLETFNIDQVADRILSQSTDSTFIDLGSDYHWHGGKVVTDELATGAEAILFSVNSPDYQEIITGPFIDLAPGDYKAVFRMKVSDNQDSQGGITIAVSYPNYAGIGGNLTGFTEIARKQFTPDDFPETNIYQEIEIPFTVDRISLNLEFITSFRGGSMELTADNIKVIRTEPDSFPVFAPLLIVTTLAGEQYKFPARFTRLFESGGGIVLTPDEFMAALNPEYMIDMAAPILGAGDSSVVRATEQLIEGDHFGSLLTIRNGLKGIMIPTSITSSTYPKSFHLGNIYPNPFRKSTTIEFSTSKTCFIKAEVFDLQGSSVRPLLNKIMPPGDHKIFFDAQSLSPGIYVLHLNAGGIMEVRKMLYIR